MAKFRGCLKFRYKKYAEIFNQINKFQRMGDSSKGQKVLELVFFEKIEKVGKITSSAVTIYLRFYGQVLWLLKLRYKKYAENFNQINKFQLMGDWSNSQKVLEPVLIEKIEKEGKTTARAVDIDADVKMSTDTDAEVIMDDTLMHLSNNFQRLINE